MLPALKPNKNLDVRTLHMNVNRTKTQNQLQLALGSLLRGMATLDIVE
jgi:hypothetical protein